MKRSKTSKYFNEFTEDRIKHDILKLLSDAKKSLSLLEIRKTVEGADRGIMRELEASGEIKVSEHFLENNGHVLVHPETQEREKIKGTKVNVYSIIKNKIVEGDR